MDPKPVKSCLCYQYTFFELMQMAKENRWSTVEQISGAVGCGTGCGLCRPYLQKMLRTGEVEFEIINTDTDN